MNTTREIKPLASAANLNITRYRELLRVFAPKRIETAKENRLALQLIDGLMEKGDAARTPEEDAVLTLLATLVQSFEAQTYTLPETTPVEMLKMLMENNELKPADLADTFGSRSKVSEILSGNRSISKEMAKRLGARFHVSPALFI